ncbi:hypothetical protein SUGI_0092850 [Cryptomeria japonica]|nr:hypothetical protein SUGI_0092850 [Cryptomeria japonica]
MNRVAMYGVSVITQAFVGQIGDLELAAISMIINVIWGFKFGLLAQLKNMAIAYTASVALILHVLMSWVFTVKLGWSLARAVVSMNLACVKIWYMKMILLLTFKLQNLQVADDSLSICMTINGWEFMIPIAFLVGTSVRVSNELGAGNGKAAKFSAVVSATTSLVIGIVIFVLLIVFRNSFASLFTQSATIHHPASSFETGTLISIHHSFEQCATSSLRCGDWNRKTTYHCLCECNIVFGSWSSTGSYSRLFVSFGCNGYLDGYAVWDCSSDGCNYVYVFRTDWNREATIATSRVKTWSSSHCDREEQP